MGEVEVVPPAVQRIEQELPRAQLEGPLRQLAVHVAHGLVGAGGDAGQGRRAGLDLLLTIVW